MSARAHLFAVPDPEPDDESGPGPRPVPVPALAVPALPDQPHTPDAPETPAEPDGTDDLDVTDAGEGDDDVEAGEEPRRGGLPDLRPYYDPRPLAELGPLAVEVSKTVGPPVLRALGRLIAFAARALGRLVVLTARGLFELAAAIVLWLTGQIGTKGSVGFRLCLGGFIAYAIAELSQRHPITPWLVAAAAVLLATLLASGRLNVPDSNAKKKAAKGGGSGEGKTPAKKGKGAPAKGGKDAAGDAEEPPGEDTEEVAKEDAPAGRGTLFGRLFRSPADDPGTDNDEGPADDPETHGDEGPADDLTEDDDETPVEGPEDTPVEDPLTALIRAQIGTENGVHLADLRPAMRASLPGLSEATDQELRQVLVRAGWDPSRTFRARGAAGRAGVHRDQLPPRHSPGAPPRPPAQHSPPPSPGPRPADSSLLSAHSPGGGEWTEEEMKRGFRAVPDPDRGPAASRIERYRR